MTNPTTPFVPEGRWVRRAADRQPEHQCKPPTRILAPEVEGIRHVPDGARGDIWRCDLDDQHWVIGLASDTCETGGHGDPPTGMCTVGLTWRPIAARKARRLVRRAERGSR